MSLPIRTTIPDADALCGYLSTKPTGATMSEAKAVLDSKVLDGRKIAAMKFWGLVEEDGQKLRITERGRILVKDGGARRSAALRETVAATRPYNAIVERAVHRAEQSISATDLAAHWFEHFSDDASHSDRILNDQAVCFFQLAEGADLGRLVVGRKGQPTRFEFDMDNARSFVGGEKDFAEPPSDSISDVEGRDLVNDHGAGTSATTTEIDHVSQPSSNQPGKRQRVFITHGKNKKILSGVKEIVAFGKFEPVIAQEHETPAKPVPDKVLDDMRSCDAAIIHVGSEGILHDDEGKDVRQINGNVLIEIGAAMALYGRKFILLVEDGVQLPSNLQGLYECRYSGDELSGEATIKLLKAFNDFAQ